MPCVCEECQPESRPIDPTTLVQSVTVLDARRAALLHDLRVVEACRAGLVRMLIEPEGFPLDRLR